MKNRKPTALCPGFVNAGMIAKEGGKKAMNVPCIRNLEPADMARQGFDACVAGKPLYINGAGNRAAVEASATAAAALAFPAGCPAGLLRGIPRRR